MKNNLILILFLLIPLFSFAQPINDDCGDVPGTAAIVMSIDTNNCGVSSIIRGNNKNATYSSGVSTLSAWQQFVERDVWYEFTLPQISQADSIEYLISLTSHTNNAFPRLSIYKGNCNFPIMIGFAATSAEKSLVYETDTCIKLKVPNKYYLRIDNVGIPDSMDFTIYIRPCQQPVIDTLITRTICDGEYYNDYTTSGTYMDIFTGINGCDSVQTLDLTVNIPTSPTITSLNDTTLRSSSAISYQWYLNDSSILNATNQTYTILQSGHYFVEIMDSNGCLTTSDTLYFQPTATNNVFNKTINLLTIPNPTAGQFQLEATGIPTGNWEIRLDNLIGQNVSRDKVFIANGRYTKRYDLQNHAGGIYILYLIGENGQVVTKKVVYVK